MKEVSNHSGWIRPKLVLPITSQIVTKMQVLLTIGVGSLIIGKNVTISLLQLSTIVWITPPSHMYNPRKHLKRHGKD